MASRAFRATSSARLAAPRRFCPAVEALEDRVLLATYWWGGNTSGGTTPLWWSKTDNWKLANGTTPAVPPGPADDVVFNLPNNSPPSTVDQAFGGKIRNLYLSSLFASTISLACDLTVVTPAGPAATSSMQGGTISSVQPNVSLFMIEPFDFIDGVFTGGVTLSTADTTNVTKAGVNWNATPTLDNATWTNSGTASVAVNATLDVKNGASITNTGQFNVNGGTVTNSAGGATFTNRGTLLLAGSFTTATFGNRGSFILNGNGDADFTGTAIQDTVVASTTFNGGSITAQGVKGYEVAAGTLTGSPTSSSITGNLTNSGGTVIPGFNTGVLNVSGDYEQTAGTLLITALGNGTNSTLSVCGQATLGATRLVNFFGTLPANITWPIIPYCVGRVGDFGTFQTNGPTYYHVVPDVNNTYVIALGTPPGGGGGEGGGGGPGGGIAFRRNRPAFLAPQVMLIDPPPASSVSLFRGDVSRSSASPCGSGDLIPPNVPAGGPGSEAAPANRIIPGSRPRGSESTPFLSDGWRVADLDVPASLSAL